MHTIHIITEEKIRESLQNVLTAQGKAAEIFLLKDKLNLGLLKVENATYEEGRNNFFRLITENSNYSEIDDLSRLMAVSTRLTNGENTRVCFWMGNNATDVCAYFWLLHYMKKHAGKIEVIKIAGLPFLDEDNNLFYPDKIDQLPEKELSKALKLRRLISGSEWELEQDGWKELLVENAEIRILIDGKKLTGHPISFYDKLLVDCCNKPSQRILTIVQHADKELKSQVAIPFLQYRLHVLNENGIINIVQNKVERMETENAVSNENS